MAMFFLESFHFYLTNIKQGQIDACVASAEWNASHEYRLMNTTLESSIFHLFSRFKLSTYEMFSCGNIMY